MGKEAGAGKGAGVLLGGGVHVDFFTFCVFCMSEIFRINTEFGKQFF